MKKFLKEGGWTKGYFIIIFRESFNNYLSHEMFVHNIVVNHILYKHLTLGLGRH